MWYYTMGLIIIATQLCYLRTYFETLLYIFDRESIAAVLQATKLDFDFFFFFFFLDHFKNFFEHGEIQDKFESMMKSWSN